MANIQYHYNRRPRNFLHRKVREALPEFFTQDYPKLVTFLEKYYDYLDSDGASSFDYRLRKIYQTRDTQRSRLHCRRPTGTFQEIGQAERLG